MTKPDYSSPDRFPSQKADQRAQWLAKQDRTILNRMQNEPIEYPFIVLNSPTSVLPPKPQLDPSILNAFRKQLEEAARALDNKKNPDELKISPIKENPYELKGVDVDWDKVRRLLKRDLSDKPLTNEDK